MLGRQIPCTKATSFSFLGKHGGQGVPEGVNFPCPNFHSWNSSFWGILQVANKNDDS
ncbi:unnamed protein product [Natator depressus]